MTDPRKTTHARGSFEVKIVSNWTEDTGEGSPLAGMSLDKQFHGDLEAHGKGQMLSAFATAPGSGAYVAIERVAGTLNGRRGSFVLVHRGIMTRGAQDLTLLVVPDSGTGELTGLAGSLEITITNGEHFYDLEYTLDEP
jgi:hypothetical protein